MHKIYLSDGVTELANVKSVTFKEAVNTGEFVRPGCVCSAYIEVKVLNTQDSAVELGDVVYCKRADINDTLTLIGEFNCEPVISTRNSYKFTAYDNAIKLDADFSQWLRENNAEFPMSIYDLVSAACDVAEVTLGSSSWPLSTQLVPAFYADGLTCRDILSYAAELACRFVRCRADGNVYFDWYAAVTDTIAPSVGTDQYAYKQDGLTYANFATEALDRVVVYSSGEDGSAYGYPADVTEGNTLYIKDNLLLLGTDGSFYSAVAENIYTVLSALGTYRPMTATLFPRECPFRAGDIVSISDSQGMTFTSPIMSVTVSNASAVLVSEGREEYEDVTNPQKALVQLASGTSQSLSELETRYMSAIQQSQESILLTVSEQTYNKTDVDDIIESVSTSIEATANGLDIKFTTLVAEATDTAEAADAKYNALQSYIRASGGVLTFGEVGSEITLQIENDEIGIYVNGEKTTYWTADNFISPSKLKIPVGGKLYLGDFAFIPRSNGSLDFTWVGA